MKEKIKALPKKWLVMVVLFVLSLVIIFISSIDNKPNEEIATPDQTQEQKNKEAQAISDEYHVHEEPNDINWYQEIDYIAFNGEYDNAEKYEETMVMAEKYFNAGSKNSVFQDEIKLFEQEMIQTFKDRTYVTKYQDTEFMLQNLFKSRIIELYYEDAQKHPMNIFSFDYHTNVKNVFESIEDAEGDWVKATEVEMSITLKEIEKNKK